MVARRRAEMVEETRAKLIRAAANAFAAKGYAAASMDELAFLHRRGWPDARRALSQFRRQEGSAAGRDRPDRRRNAGAAARCTGSGENPMARISRREHRLYRDGAGAGDPAHHAAGRPGRARRSLAMAQPERLPAHHDTNHPGADRRGNGRPAWMPKPPPDCSMAPRSTPRSGSPRPTIRTPSWRRPSRRSGISRSVCCRPSDDRHDVTAIGSTAPDLRRYRRKAGDRILRILEVFTFEEGCIDHGENRRHDRKSHDASHAASLVARLRPVSRRTRASIPGICKLFSGLAVPDPSFLFWNKLRTL